MAFRLDYHSQCNITIPIHHGATIPHIPLEHVSGEILVWIHDIAKIDMAVDHKAADALGLSEFSFDVFPWMAIIKSKSLRGNHEEMHQNQKQSCPSSRVCPR
jgi:hypothetical protein